MPNRKTAWSLLMLTVGCGGTGGTNRDGGRVADAGVLTAAASQRTLAFEPGPRGLSARSPRGFIVHLDGDAVEATSRGHRVRFRLVGYGDREWRGQVAGAIVDAAERTVSYDRGDIAESYENRADGVEQRFVLREVPADGWGGGRDPA